MNSSISRRLVIWLAVPLSLLALCGVLVHYFNSVAPVGLSTEHRLKDAVGTLSARLRVEDGKISFTPIAPPSASLLADGSVRFAVHDGQRHLLAGDAALPQIAVAGAADPVYSRANVAGRAVRMLTSRVQTAAGPAVISVADEPKANEPAARFGFMSTLLWDFVQLDITLVLVWVGVQLGLRPVKQLRDQIADRSAVDLQPIGDAKVPRELAPLVGTLNRLFSMLRTSVQSQQQFIANTAHQLRTPITGMLAQLDLLINEPAAEPIRRRLVTLQEGVRQLAHSANQVLALARADPAVNLAAKNQSVELGSIVSEVVARFLDRAVQSNIDLGVELQSASVVADPSLLDDLLSNLVDNAMKYTPAGGRVTVSTGTLEARPFLAVEDDGRGIPEAERQRVRQRFYRLPDAPGHGSGLGLAIVEEIARLYEATVNIAGGPGGLGTKVSVHFPVPLAP